MTWEYDSAGPGNVALIGGAAAPGGAGARLRQQHGVGRDAGAHRAVRAVRAHPGSARSPTGRGWHAAVAPSAAVDHGPARPECASRCSSSTMVLRAHLDKTYPGAMVASLSVPWGNTSEERERLSPGLAARPVRMRRRVAGGRRAARGARHAALSASPRRLADGHWNQNQWLGGTPYWTGVQLDETAFPVLLAAELEERERAATASRSSDMMRRALALHRAQRAGERPGPLGGGRRASTPSRWRRASRRWSPARATSTRDARELALAVADYWNAQSRGLDRGHRHPARARSTACPATTCASRRRRGLADDRGAPTRVLPIRNQRGAIRGCRPARRSASTSCSSCASGCAAPMIR